MLFQETKYKTSWETPPEKKKKKHVWDTTLPSPYCNLKETVGARENLPRNVSDSGQEELLTICLVSNRLSMMLDKTSTERRKVRQGWASITSGFPSGVEVLRLLVNFK